VERVRCRESWRPIDDLPKNVLIGVSRSEKKRYVERPEMLYVGASQGREGEPRQRHDRGLRLAIKLARRLGWTTFTVSRTPFSIGKRWRVVWVVPIGIREKMARMFAHTGLHCMIGIREPFLGVRVARLRFEGDWSRDVRG
jgi:hypothetical protein